MKYFLFFFLIVTTSHSQTGKITYSSVFNFGGNVNQTENNLYFTSFNSFYQTRLEVDKKTEREEKAKTDSENSKVVEINIAVGTDSIGSIYYYNYKNRDIICREPIYENGKLKYFLYEDDAVIKWEMLDEFKEISGYKCQKAATTFRGRNYEAWFTSEIPHSFGPWKFNGLPGLILEVYDLAGAVYFSAEQVQIPFEEGREKVQKPSGDKLISHREFVEKQNETSIGITQAMLARLPEGAELVSTETKKDGIELKYEWDKE